MPPSGRRECGVRRSFPNSLAFPGRGVRWGMGRGGGGSDSAALDHLLPPAGPSRRLAGRGAGAEPQAGQGPCERAPRLRTQIISFFLFPTVPSSSGARRRGAGFWWLGVVRRPARRVQLRPQQGLSAPRSLCSGLPKLSSPGFRAAQEEVRRGGGGGLGRAKVRNNKKRTNKQNQSNARGTFSQLFLESYFLNCQRGVAPFRTLSAAGHKPQREAVAPAR